MGVGTVMGVGIVAFGSAMVASGIVLAGAGIAEAGATGGAGIFITLLAVHEGAEIATAGLWVIAGGALVLDDSVGRAVRCGGVR